MLLVKMEDYSSLLPPLSIDDAFTLSDSYGDGLYGRKRKKKPDVVVAECRLDSPCASPEVIMSGGMDDSTKRSTNLLRGDSFTDAHDSVDHGSMFGGVDMEGFCEINATMTADEDIMLSSSAKENRMVLKEVAAKHDLPMVDEYNVSHGVSSVSNSSGLQSEFESDVDALLDNCLWQNKQVGSSGHDLLPDLSGLAVSGYLLSDIPSHPDLSCEAGESVDSLISYCNDKDECLSSPSAVPRTESNKEQLLSSVKCEEDVVSSQHQHEDIYSDFEALCTKTLHGDRQTDLNNCPRTSSCRCPGRVCLCYKSSSDTSSADEEDVCLEYIVSHLPSKVKRAKARRPAPVRRGPGRPRKLQNTDFVRRGPGRPRKKSVSDAVVWYQTRRKRTVSLSNGYKSRSRQKSVSEAKDARDSVTRVHVRDNAADTVVKPKLRHRGETLMQLTSDSERTSSLQSEETGINILLCGHPDRLPPLVKDAVQSCCAQ